MTPAGPVPIDVWAERKRREREAYRPPSPPPAPPPPPNRSDLMAALAEARSRRAVTADRLSRSEAALQRGLDIAESARKTLRDLDESDARRDEGLSSRLRQWIASGSADRRPHAARLSVAEVQARQQAEADHVASQGAMSALEEERDIAKGEDEAALAALRAAARAIVRLDAIEMAEEIAELERQAAERWQVLWGMAFARLGDAPIGAHPLIAGAIRSPPRAANRTNVPPATRTEEGRKAVEAAQARFDALVAGEDDGGDGDAPEAAQEV